MIELHGCLFLNINLQAVALFEFLKRLVRHVKLKLFMCIHNMDYLNERQTILQMILFIIMHTMHHSFHS